MVKEKASENISLFRKADVIVLAVAVLIAMIPLFMSGSRDAASNDAKVRVVSGGKLYGEYSLHEDKTIRLPNNDGIRKEDPDSSNAGKKSGSSNVIEIKGGRVRMKSANCPGQDCVHQGSIERPGESIACLPNKVIVTIHSESHGTNGEPDAVAG